MVIYLLRSVTIHHSLRAIFYEIFTFHVFNNMHTSFAILSLYFIHMIEKSFLVECLASF